MPETGDRMNLPPDKIAVWLIVGALAGWLAGVLVKRNRSGFGHIANTFIGLVGAFLGGILFKTFNIDFGLGAVTVRLDDLVSAFAGSLVFLLILWILRRGR